jgi:hypothetical protein
MHVPRRRRIIRGGHVYGRAPASPSPQGPRPGGAGVLPLV